MKRDRTKAVRLISASLTVVAVLIAAIWFARGIELTDTGRENRQLQNMEAAIRRAAAACYAAEGAYPPDLDYLTEHYGIQIDYDRYSVFYDAFAENLMPDITVIKK